jgi:outer membrane protein TolC
MLQSVKMRKETQSNQGRLHAGIATGAFLLLFFAAAMATPCRAQVANSPESPVAPAAPVSITLEEAIRRAEANEPAFAAAVAESKVSALDRSIARSALLPNAVYHNQGTYTQSNSPNSTDTPRFIANNGRREYISQGVVNETLGLGPLAAVRHADAAAARAAAELEVARRGLVSAVTSLYFEAIAAENKLAIAQRAHEEAVAFTHLTDQREQAREAAHADKVKAQLFEQQRERELSDARLAAEKSRLELGVLLFPDPRTPCKLSAGDAVPDLPARAAVDEAAAKNNPELKSALASVSMSNADVLSARSAYFPDIGLNFNYGIDAFQFAVNAPDHTRNLGYSAVVTVDIPVWDWLSTGHKVKQSEIRRDASKVALSATQRHLIARLDEAFSEATAAREQLASLDASVTTAAESLRLTKLRYAEGEALVLEVVDAQTSFVGAEMARQDGRVRYQAARADLQTLTGAF